MKISRVLHAGYLFQENETQIIFDPIFENPFSQNCFAFPSVEFDLNKIQKLKLSAIFISHIHDDHCSMVSLNRLNKNTPVYIYTQHPEMISLLKALGFKKVHSLELDQTVFIDSFEVTPRKALNSDVDSIFEIISEGIKVLNVVDSWIDPMTIDSLIKKAPWDLILWPFQILREVEVLSPQTYPIEKAPWPQEWIEQIGLLKPRYLVPSSCQFRHEEWSWYNKALFSYSYKEFFEIINRNLPQAISFKMNPGESINLSSQSLEIEKSLDWIHVAEFVDQDYQLDPNLKVPDSCEIAKKFPSLNWDQKKVIDHFVQNEIQSLYSIIGPSSDRFFNKTQIWRLSIFNSEGREIFFDYRLGDDSILKLDLNPSFDWKTEISEFKLYQALEQGESLTSLYLRVYGSPEVDVLEDPLIRILYSRDPLVYQKAQLRASML